MKGLIIKAPWINLILEGKKTLEIRGCNTKTRGLIALIESGTGLIVGEAVLIASFRLSEEELDVFKNKHCVKGAKLTELKKRYKKYYGWIITSAKRYEKPIPYKHPQGAVIWVNLEGV